MATIRQILSSKCFEGNQKIFEHNSKELGCMMKFTIFLPSTAEQPSIKLPVVYFLSGRTSSEQELITKFAMQRYAEEYKLIVVGADTSPRGCNVPGEDDSYDLGTGASFYVDAIQEPWSKNYRMYSYITKELRAVITENFPQADEERIGICGHSMGGHGALVIFLRNPDIYKAVSAFAPLCHPIKSKWGVKCLSNYIGDDETRWLDYDATELVRRQPQKNVKILIDQGDQDVYYDELMTDTFAQVCQEVGQPIEYNKRLGYDHKNYFVATFMENHMKHFSHELRK